MDGIKNIVVFAGQSNLFKVLCALVVMDVIFGCLRAIKEKQFNSNIGINGMIRKAGMMISLICLIYIDRIISIDLIGFIPDGILNYLPVQHIGTMEFFAIIYIIYEVLSVLKNMTLSGLPVNKIWETLRKFLKDSTGEIIDEKDLDNDEGVE